MHVLEASILLIALIVISSIVSHYVTVVPTALIQIAMGLVVAILFHTKIQLEADWFMLLFVAPLLFNDGQEFPKNELWELRAPIFANAIWLVLLTSLLGGYLVYLFIPTIPLPLAIALAAVLSPTDPVAVHGIAEQVKLPKRILSLVSGESLINDASGLIAFKYALAAFLTGQFSLFHATADFFYMAVIGALIGYVMMHIFYKIRLLLNKHGVSDVVLHTTIQLITPFLIFIIAEELAHVSGVIAVVTAGVLSINRPPIFSSKFSEISLVTKRSWDLLVYLLNGAVFIILGIGLPMVMKETFQNSGMINWLLFGYIFVIWFILLSIRFIWSYSYLRYSALRSQRVQSQSFLTALLTGLTGVRGSITMATVLSIPLLLPNKEPFHERSLIISLACGVIVLSLLVAAVTLPILTKQRKRLLLTGDHLETEPLPVETTTDDFMSEGEAHLYILQKAIQFLRNEKTAENQLVIVNLLHEFTIRFHLVTLDQNNEALNTKYREKEQHIRCIALNGEKQVLQALRTENKISLKIYRKQKKFLSFKQQRGTKNFRYRIEQHLVNIQRILTRAVIRFFPATNISSKQKDLLALEVKQAKGAIQELHSYKKQLPPTAKLEKNLTSQLLLEYRNKIDRIYSIGKYFQENYPQQLLDYYLKTLDHERSVIQDLIHEGRLDSTTANKLRQSLNYTESTILQDNK